MGRSEQQITDTLLMIRPAQFAYNPETAASNIFQKTIGKGTIVHSQALKEFDLLVKKLREHKIYVIVLQDSESPLTPDSIFPNNWISFHGKEIILYPMLAENRRLERRSDWIEIIKSSFGISEVKDFSNEELKGKFLEGTGSLVLDRKNKIAYANISSRTNFELARHWCAEMNFELISFNSSTRDGKEIYHTNVLMAIGERVAILCSEVIRDENDRKKVHIKLSQQHHVVEISEEQMNHFAGNMLLVKNRDREKFWVMSQQAFDCLSSSQNETLKLDGEFLLSDLKTIEAAGGGSARCMIAEIL
ncbi:MAG TPA: arginine deiminase-related protein [Chitinophagales bacterium]|nr:arginine deiminase-related protein [Chitinophagales bacterium]